MEPYLIIQTFARRSIRQLHVPTRLAQNQSAGATATAHSRCASGQTEQVLVHKYSIQRDLPFFISGEFEKLGRSRFQNSWPQIL